MKILGVDTSCDDTSAALLDIDDGKVSIITNIVSSQNAMHSKYGGIVPELASRCHMEMIWPVVDEALAGHELDELDAVSVCMGPGLVGSLLVGCAFTKAMCYASSIPLVAVNHLEGHLLSIFLEGTAPRFPVLALVVSGGHTSLYIARDFGQYEELGRTRDDAAGEAFDKVAKMVGLPYPGGPEIDRLAQSGDPKAANLPRPYMPKTYDFSFSGLKTASRLAYERDGHTPEDIAAGFQASVSDVLVRKVKRAIKEYEIKTVALTGGVAANSEIRKKMADMCKGQGARLLVPSVAFCTDNAAMIAMAGYHRFQKGELAPLSLNPKAHLPLT